MINNFELEMIARLVLAAFLGGIIGAEREKRSKHGAGLRTHSLVCVSSTLVMLVSAYGFMQVLSPGRIILDPSRIAAQVVTGVGFLGAGIIIFRRNVVRGLTTAASIWAVSAIGLATGCGLYVAALSSTVVVWTILAVVKRFEQKYFPQRQLNMLAVEVTDHRQAKTVSDMFKREGIKLYNLSIRRVLNKPTMMIHVEAMAEEKKFVELLHELQALPIVESVEYTGDVLMLDDLSEIDDDALER